MVAEQPEIIFIAVQTPHDPRYEGITPIPYVRADFDYTHLVAAVRALATRINYPVVIDIISTCLPGTMRSRIKPHLNSNMSLVYNPFFIAMGTTMKDFLNPEFVLLGSEDDAALAKVKEFYREIYPEPSHISIRSMNIESAELCKVAYNTYISLKIAWANTIMEICYYYPKADCDEICEAIKHATDRIVSPKYMSGGMGDGGGCHPRDNIAMSWLAQQIGLSFDIFEAAMVCREKQAEWKAKVLWLYASTTRLPPIILGYAFKPETNLTVGSPALLVADAYKSLADVAPRLLDEYVNPEDDVELPTAVYLIGCRHERYQDIVFPKGSVVIDPHRMIPDQEGVKVIRLGEAEADE
jgi:UDPglucose 6-dehydrogenase